MQRTNPVPDRQSLARSVPVRIYHHATHLIAVFILLCKPTCLAIALEQTVDRSPAATVHIDLCASHEPFNRGAAHCWYALEHSLSFPNLIAEVRARLRVAADLNDQGFYEEAESVLAPVRENLLEEYPELRCSYLLARGQMYLHLWDFDAARADLDLAARIAKESFNWSLEVAIRQILSRLEISLGKLETGGKQLEAAIAITEEHAAGEESLKNFFASLSAKHQVNQQEKIGVELSAKIQEEFDRIITDPSSGPPYENFSVDPVEVDYLATLECSLPVKWSPAWRSATCDLDMTRKEIISRLKLQHLNASMIEDLRFNDISMQPSREVCASFFQSDLLFDLADIRDLIGDEREAAEVRDEAWRVWGSTTGKVVNHYSSMATAMTEAIQRIVRNKAPMEQVDIDFTLRRRTSRRAESTAAVGLSPLGHCRRWTLNYPVEKIDPVLATRHQGQPHQLIDNFEHLGWALALPFEYSEKARKSIDSDDPESAWSFYGQAIDWIDRLSQILPVTTIEYASSTSNILEEIVLFLATQGRTVEAFEYSERARSLDLQRRLQSDTGKLRLDDAQRAQLQEVTRWLAVEQEQLASLERVYLGGEQVESYRQGVQKASEMRDKVVSSIRQANPTVGYIFSREAISTHELQRNFLPQNTTLISYFTASEASLVWIIEKESVKMVRLPISRSEVQQLAKIFIRTLQQDRTQPGDTNAAHDWRTASDRLYQALITPLTPHLQNPNLLLIPHGPLHFLPFAALTEPGGSFLVNNYSISMLPSAMTLYYAFRYRNSELFKPLVLGDPDFTLPSARKEALSVSRQLGTSAILGNAASKEHLMQRIGHFNLLHIATHGWVDPDDPDSNWLKLAPNEADRLLISDVYGLDLRNVRLVVLSACKTGIGRVTVGDEILTFARAFMIAGASSIVASLWAVDDDSSAFLMESFYQHLTENPSLGLASALRRAQLQTAAEYGGSPYYWAGFILVGDPSPLRLITH